MGYSCSRVLKLTCSFLFILNLVGATNSFKNTKCPFQYLYHFGDGITDIGNSALVLPWGPSLPAARLPYGRTFPGTPTGRWSDGLIDFDFAAADFGFPHITPYLSRNASSSNGVIFSVARSPVLHHKFFALRGIEIPPYAVPLRVQLSWFKKHLKSVCSSPTECKNRLGNSLVLMGDIEGNDIGYALSQGKSIEEVTTYVPYVIRALINSTKKLIKMGARVIIIPGNGPLGCYPYILTASPGNDPKAYDELGCLRSVNDLITLKNNHLQQAISDLRKEYPNVRIFYGAFDKGVLSVLAESRSFAGPRGPDMALRACCGIGGKYNFDPKRLCGSKGVPVCSNPDEYVFWDGLHFTQKAYHRIEKILIKPALSDLNCTS